MTNTLQLDLSSKHDAITTFCFTSSYLYDNLIWYDSPPRTFTYVSNLPSEISNIGLNTWFFHHVSLKYTVIHYLQWHVRPFCLVNAWIVSWKTPPQTVWKIPLTPLRSSS